MIRWRARFALSRLIPLTLSLGLVTIANGLWPGVMVGWLTAGVLIGWLRVRSRLWRCGVRAPSESEVALVRGVGGLVPELRGRAEPRWWISRSSRGRTWMPTRRDAVVCAGLIDAVRAGRVPAEHVAAHLAAEHGRLPVTTSMVVSILNALCLPAWLLAVILPRQLRRSWHWYPLAMAGLAAVAVVQESALGRWPTAGTLSLLAGALVIGPVWADRWHDTLERLGSNAVTQARLSRQYLRWT